MARGVSERQFDAVHLVVVPDAVMRNGAADLAREQLEQAVHLQRGLQDRRHLQQVGGMLLRLLPDRLRRDVQRRGGRHGAGEFTNLLGGFHGCVGLFVSVTVKNSNSSSPS